MILSHHAQSGRSLEFESKSTLLFNHMVAETHKRYDRSFSILLLAEWLALVVIALTFSPRTWEGAQSFVHPHVWIAFILGGVACLVPAIAGFRAPGLALTRHAIAVGQMFVSIILIHISGGRIESHFHIFASLAFLAFYRDWKVILSATVVAAGDHVLRGAFYPSSIFGLDYVDAPRIAEHALWVVFEDAFLVMACLNGTRDKKMLADRHVESEEASEKASQLLAATEALQRDLHVGIEFMAEGMNSVASGDLTIRAEESGSPQLLRLFADFNSFVGRMEAVIGQMKGSAEKTGVIVTDASNQFAHVLREVHTLSVMSSELATTTEQISHSLEHGAGLAQNALNLAKTNGDSAETGRSVVAESVKSIRLLREIVDGSAETMQRLGDSSEQIGSISEVITDIADQTNLLALNAAIEAARAGEQGRGFAVVADEVRRLAERTSQATKEIGATVRLIQRETQSASESMNRGSSEVNHGLTLAERASKALDEIVVSARELRALTSEIKDPAEMQSSAGGEVTTNGRILNERSCGLRQMVDSAAHGIGELEAQSEQVIGAMTYFRTTRDSTSRRSTDRYSGHGQLKHRQLQSA